MIGAVGFARGDERGGWDRRWAAAGVADGGGEVAVREGAFLAASAVLDGAGCCWAGGSLGEGEGGEEEEGEGMHFGLFVWEVLVGFGREVEGAILTW